MPEGREPRICNTNIGIRRVGRYEDTKGVIIIGKSKKNRQHNGQKKNTKGQTTIYKTYTKN